MSTVTIRDVQVKFPFPPYDIQNNYMSKVIECIETSQNGILESPTGTGKTLSLLCASLGWLENRKKQYEHQKQQLLFKSENCEDDPALITVPKIIYSSRTHTQLQQVVQEMKRTAYSHMKACVLGSREQMCINDEVMSEKNSGAKVNICRSLVKRNQCSFYNKIEKQRSNKDLCELNIVDIEDIVTLGQTHRFCPYYMARELTSGADVIFMPYNYLLDPKFSSNIGSLIPDSIIIFDEAHNIEKVCEESVSVQISTKELQNAIADVAAVLDLLQDKKKLDVQESTFTPEELNMLNVMLMETKKQLDGVTLVPLAPQGTVFDGDYIYALLEKANINDANYLGVVDLLNGIQEFLSSTKRIQSSGYGLQVLGQLLFIAFYKTGAEFRQKIKECFKVQIAVEQTTQRWNKFSQYSQKDEEKCRVLNFWCFCPGFGMNILIDRKVRCVILTSGTLAPLKPLISELELAIGVRIENPHIVKPNQICVKIVTKGPNMEPLNSNFKNRNNPKYIESLGYTISNLIRVIPDGVLIFFPSYFIMEKTIEAWEQNGTWDTINGIKPIYIEPKDKTAFHEAMTEYYSKIQDPAYKGAIFMGVCRGKVSEGLDFADVNGRAVFITGLPYPPLKDPKIILKKQYLDFRYSKDKEYLKGDDWYTLEATRAINQAIGRVIRHKNDYGAIILLDARFVNFYVKNNLSLWLRQHVTEIKNFGDAIRGIRNFFQNISIETKMEEEDLEASTSSPTRKGELLESPPKRSK